VPTKRRAAAGIGVTAVIALMALTFAWRANRASEGQAGMVVQQIRAGDLTIVLLSPTGALHQGRNTFTIEFRSANGALVDVGTVRASANMPMPGMVMSGGLEVSRTSVPGRYHATAEFGMAGAWQMTVEWDGPAGHGAVNFQGTVR
jgi:hypothetical protein